MNKKAIIIAENRFKNINPMQIRFCVMKNPITLKNPEMMFPQNRKVNISKEEDEEENY